MPRASRKQRLYELGRAALSGLVGQEVADYVCPICLQGFESPLDLSEEHVPPRSMGGKVLCLTCRECNCEAGHTIEAQMDREKASRTFLAVPDEPRRARLIVGCHEARVDVRHHDNSIHLEFPPAVNDRKALTALEQALASQGSFQLCDTVSYSRRHADVGYLKSAYLGAFAKLGYKYILRTALDRVRHQLRQPDHNILDTIRVYMKAGDPSGRDLRLFCEPVRCMGITVGHSMICLPLVDGDDGFYEELAELRKNGEARTWRGYGTIAWPTGLELALDLGSREKNRRRAAQAPSQSEDKERQ